MWDGAHGFASREQQKPRRRQHHGPIEAWRHGIGLFDPATHRMEHMMNARQQPSARIREMCGRARLSSDVSEIKSVFRIPPERPTPNIMPSWNVTPTRVE
jgi:hypothetical protein